MHDQLRIPMPIIGVQMTLRRTFPTGWEVRRSVLRQDQGWQPAGRWGVGTRDRAEVVALEELGEAWGLPPLD